MNRFWHAVAQNDGKNMFFHVVMFLWSFPRQHFEIFTKIMIFDVNNQILQLDRYLMITSCSVNRFCSFLDWDNEKIVFFHVVMFLWSFPRQRSALSSKTDFRVRSLKVLDRWHPFKRKNISEKFQGFGSSHFG